MSKPIAHKSPSARTPSASGPAHPHQPSTSSHQYATPLAATTGIDDAVTFSSPSALLALGGFSGISPSPAGHDGLVGTGMNDNDIQALGMQGLKLGTARDSEEERRRHIEDVVHLLRTRVAGRGVSREGIERLAQLEGFESIWQEDNINIAGNFVDLEIEFYPGQNAVKDVSLSYATPEATDGERREEATAVLKRHLIQPPDEGDRGVWKPLAGFCENLQWLAKLDRLSQEVNCFEAIEGLFESLKRVWDEESKKPKFAGSYEHLCSGWIGRPCIHKGSRIGFRLDYWVQQARALDTKQKKVSPDSMVVDQPSDQLSEEEMGIQQKTWSVMIECEEGYPPLRVSKDWVGSEIFTPINSNEISSSNEPANPDATMVNWSDPPQTSSSMNQGHSDAMAIDSDMMGSSAPNRRFVAKIEPPLDVPILAASDIYRNLGLQLPQEFKMVTYDGLLVPGWSPLSAGDTIGIGPGDSPQIDRRKRRMPVQAFDQEGKQCTKQHSYTFQAFESVAGRTMRDIPFSHPRQLADILPILRQYALLASMIRKIFNPSTKDDHIEKDFKPNSSVKNSPNSKPDKPARKGLIVLSNKDPNEEKLNSLLNGLGSDSSVGDAHGGFIPKDDVKVDVTLRTQLGQAPVMMLLFTVNDASLGKPVPATEEPGMSKISINFEIGLNGRISVVDTSGLWEDQAAEQAADGQKEEKSEVQQRIARVLEISQDLGILVEWILRWLRQRKDSSS
ncbi:hypothetical protein MW887_009092 [Aspergillus wentii]|nr:hypothetical protein MW887_009092 [Aspergillus wentii]